MLLKNADVQKVTTKMKAKLLKLVFCWIFFTASVLAQKLTLRAENVKLSECYQSEPASLAVNAAIIINAHNGSDDRILLLKKLNIVSEVKVAKSQSDALAGKYLFVINYDIFSSAHEANTKPKLNDFDVLQPGKYYVSKIIHQFTATNTDRSGSFLHQGEYWIQLTIIPVPLSLWANENAIAKYRHKWQERGQIYSEPLTTEPFKITVHEGGASRCR
jgi:hypothetical protein